jgi:hypothetical protein
LLDTAYTAKLQAAGFEAVEIEPTRTYGKDDVEALAAPVADNDAALAEIVAALDGAVMSAFIRARKPGAAGARDAAGQAAAAPGVQAAGAKGAAPATGCCGGPAPAKADACCAEDADAKASGAAGCGCGTKA